jgi:hypothetical protein
MPAYRRTGTFRALVLMKKNSWWCFELLTEICFYGIPKTKFDIILYDGAPVMLGQKSGVEKLFLDDFPNAIIWHWACHGLEFGMRDAVDEVACLNNLQLHCDQLYSFIVSRISYKSR